MGKDDGLGDHLFSFSVVSNLLHAKSKNISCYRWTYRSR